MKHEHKQKNASKSVLIKAKRSILAHVALFLLFISVAGLKEHRASVSAQAGGRAATPYVFIDTTLAASDGKTIAVAAGDDFQASLDSAKPGDVITLEAGATFTGNFVLPARRGSGWITIRSSAEDEKLPAEGQRITPGYADALPKLVSPSSEPVISTEAGAHHYRFIAVEFSLAADVTLNYGLISFGSDEFSSLDQLPHDLILDRCFVHGSPSSDLSRGVALNCASASIIDSHISDCHGEGFDAQAIASWNGSGPFKIVNNYLEGSGENVLFGGADPRISNLVASDIEFRRNTLSKPLTWKADDPSFGGRHWTVKNLFELKNARRVLAEGNIFENNWVDGQSGVAILFTPRNQDGTAPWSVVEDVTFTNNIVRHTSGAVNILGRDDEKRSEQTKRIEITNNLFDDVNGSRWGDGDGVFMIITETVDVKVDHNTVLHTGNIITAYGKPCENFSFTNNLAPNNDYGIIGDSVAPGLDTIKTFFPDATFKKNIFVGGDSSVYLLKKNYYPASFDEVGFVNKGGKNYRLSANSPFKKSGTKNKDIGANIDAIEAAIGSANLAIAYED
jgi:hypothetical protein